MSPRFSLPRALSYSHRTSALRSVLLVLPMLTMLPVGVSASQGASVEQTTAHYAIPGGALSTVLSRFAAEAGVLLSVDARRVAGLQSSGLQGRYSVEQGFAQLLRKSGLTAVADAAGNYSLQPAATSSGVTALQPMVVQGFALGNALGDMQGYNATHSSVATKTSMPLLETSQTVSVVTRQQMDDQGARTVAQALRYTPGLMSSPYGSTTRYDYVALRGINDGSVDNLYLDGQKMLGDSSTYSSLQVDQYFLERIDVLKGPSSVLYGRSLPGGLVALTTKKPEYDTRRQLQLSLGSHHSRQVGLDMTGPLDDQRRITYRITGVASKAQNQVDYIEQERYALMPSLSLDLSADTRLTLQAMVQRDPESGYHGGLPAVGTVVPLNGQRISSRFFEGEAEREKFERDQQLLGYQLEHRFSDAVSLRQSFQYLDSRVESEQVYQYGYTTDYGYGAEGDLYRAYTGAEESLHAWTLDNQLQFEFDTGALQHTLVAGLDYQRRKAKVSYTGGTVSSINPYTGERPEASYSFYQQYDEARRLEQAGLYVQDLISLNRWRLSLGLRQDWVDVSFDHRQDPVYGDQQDASKDRQRSGRIGVLYAFDNGWSPYVSYSESFNPNTTSAYNGNAAGGYDITLLDATRGKQYEAGIKFQPPGSRDLYTLSYFDLTQSNLASKDSNDSFFRPVGEITSRGLEAEARLQPRENVSLLASYTYIDATYSKDFIGSAGVNNRGNTPNVVARHMAALWADYRLAGGSLAGLQLGVGTRYFGTSWADQENTLRLPSFTLFDAALSYDLGRLGLEGVSTRLNINNLTNERYVAACNSLYQCYFGEARNVMATVSYDF